MEKQATSSDQKRSTDSPPAGKIQTDSGQAELRGAPLPKIVAFRELARCGDELWIENEGQLYRLRRTRQGKLILTK